MQKLLIFLLSKISTDYCLLVDSDVVFTVNFLDLFNTVSTNNIFLCGYERTTYKHHCIAPWCCLINMKLYNAYKLHFYDEQRILYINNCLDYDTGSSLYEDAKKLNLPIISTPDNLYYIHFKGGSVFKTAGLNWLNKNQYLWR